MKRKIAVTTGTRSEYGLLRPLLKEISRSKELELYLIVAGMHLSKKFGMTINDIKNDGFKIHAKVEMLPQGNSTFFMAKALGEGIIQFSKIFRKLQPDINLILGDRDEPFASALAASHMNIVNAHIHGGEISTGFDEYVRHSITKISNIHFAVSKKSQQRIIKLGENPKNVFLTGSPSIDEVLHGNKASKKELEKKYDLKIKGDEILLVYHPVTTQFGKSEKQIISILKAISKLKKITIAIAPNSDAGNQEIFNNLKKFSKQFDFIKTYPTIPRYDYLGFLQNFGVLVGNSSSGLIEGSYFDIPVINLGIRQKGRERGKNVIDVKEISPISVFNAIQNALQIKNKNMTKELIFGKGNTSKKITQILESITIDKNLLQKQLVY
jgi:UDP-N-acetylglucosamine 2-epimerase (non-hydrolysing)/GDP/UDP-N,N'-diacetylbacillosamine 2-epimerase (hydrolysing)